MSKINLANNRKRNFIKALITVIALVCVLFYVIMSIKNVAQMLMNFSLLTANATMLSIMINLAMYLLVIITGCYSVIKSKNPYSIIVALIAILMVY